MIWVKYLQLTYFDRNETTTSKSLFCFESLNKKSLASLHKLFNKPNYFVYAMEMRLKFVFSKQNENDASFTKQTSPPSQIITVGQQMFLVSLTKQNCCIFAVFSHTHNLFCMVWSRWYERYLKVFPS
jgi:hypothetical protein